MLSTARLRLDSWWPDDWRGFRSIAQDPEVMRYITGGIPWTDDQVKDFVDRQIRQVDRDGFCLWRMSELESPDIIGFCGLQPLAGTEDIEIGWWLARSNWGRGYATEAALAILADGFDRCSLESIVAIARPDNAASRRVMVKIGMHYEGDALHRGIPVVRYRVIRHR